MTDTSSASRKQEGKIIYNQDRAFGSQQEKDLLPTLKEYFKLDLLPLRRYDVFDYIAENTLIELKSRRTPIAQFPCTIVGKNKLDYAKKSGKDCYFVFNYPEGLYYWKYNDSLIGGEVKIGKCGRFDRGRPEVKDYAYIPISILTEIQRVGVV